MWLHQVFRKGRVGVGMVFVVAVVSAQGACARVAGQGDADVFTVDATGDTVGDAPGDSPGMCTVSPQSLDGQPCHNAGEQCGTCAGHCEGCSYALCDGTRWRIVGVGPGLCDAGYTNDAQAVACGTATCAAGALCVHTVRGGGPCRVPDDAGACGPGEVLSGGCCVSHSESWACSARPSACDPVLSCGCDPTICNAGGPDGCPCTSAAGTQVECGCYYP